MSSAVAVHTIERTLSLTPRPPHADLVRPSLKGKERFTAPEIVTPAANLLTEIHSELKAHRRISVNGPRAPKPRSSLVARPFTFKSRIPFRNLFEHPRILRGILQHISWRGFHSFSNTCRTFRLLIAHPGFRDVILVHYVPGYRLALSSRDMLQYRDVEIDLHDLSLLMITQFLPLHKYPMHALSLLGDSQEPSSSTAGEFETTRLISLTQAHSRFVLLLQSLVHSSSFPTTPEEPDDLGGYLSPLSATCKSGVRELVFPAPLSYFDSSPRSNDDAKTAQVEGKDKSSHLRSKSSASSINASSPPRIARSAAEIDTLIQRRPPLKRRLTRNSVFGAPKVLPPPPSSAPASLQYSSTWRRTLTTESARPGLRTLQSISDDEGDGLFKLKLPQRRFASANPSTDSSLDSVRSSPSPAHTRSSTTAAQYTSSQMVASPTGTSPHDLIRATSRSRAPILRVFVPCSQLDEFAVSACEEQLVDAGLWEHLSAGDVVCNFGYVPPPDTEDDSQSNVGPDGERTGHRKKWLIFNGYGLVHYIPPAPPPVSNSITLPSPFYYSHILPPLTNPIYILSLPPIYQTPSPPGSAQGSERRNPPRLQLSLVHVPTRVTSPQSAAGYAVVRKYMWLGRIPYHGPAQGAGIDASMLPGEGWYGEWILETEGTREGKQTLIDSLRLGADGQARRGMWQIIKEKSGKGKIWMRLLDPNVDPTGLDFDNENKTSSSH